MTLTNSPLCRRSVAEDATSTPILSEWQTLTSFRHTYLAYNSCTKRMLGVYIWGPSGTSVKEKDSHHMKSDYKSLFRWYIVGFSKEDGVLAVMGSILKVVFIRYTSTYGTVVRSNLCRYCIVDFYKGDSVLAIMWWILKAVSIRCMV